MVVVVMVVIVVVVMVMVLGRRRGGGSRGSRGSGGSGRVHDEGRGCGGECGGSSERGSVVCESVCV